LNGICFALNLIPERVCSLDFSLFDELDVEDAFFDDIKAADLVTANLFLFLFKRVF